MFTVDTAITDLKVKDKVLSRVFFSMNSPQIATPELSVEEARCYILVFNEGGVFRVHVGLYLPNSERRFYYSYSGNPVSEAQVVDAMEEATRFAEEMGFLLDELRLNSMSVDERNRWIENEAIFGYKKKEHPKQVDAPADVERTEERPAGTADAGGDVPTPEKEAGPEPKEYIPREYTGEAREEPAGLDEMEFQPDEQPVKPEPAARPARKKRAATQQVVEEEEEEAAAEEETEPEESAQQPVRRPAVRATAKTGKKSALSPTGTVTKEYEALARLLASF